MATRVHNSQITQPMGNAAMGRQVAEPIVASDEYMRYLSSLIPSKNALTKAGFVMKPLNKNELQAKVKCKMCNKKCECRASPPA